MRRSAHMVLAVLACIHSTSTYAPVCGGPASVLYHLMLLASAALLHGEPSKKKLEVTLLLSYLHNIHASVTIRLEFVQKKCIYNLVFLFFFLLFFFFCILFSCT